eukprot:TRINITY_DN16568_c0_g1_i1.p1 TRINITY_DN16568_c0_g1~~TRINITY_DN16568_c0_g1_i1.p1  ORF type:complete len:157 (+),score=24.63 TRINITY_DN16568_c0_g1_i1:557-1027(+)
MKNGQYQFNGFFDVYGKVGIVGLYEGFVISVVALIVQRLVYLALEELYGSDDRGSTINRITTFAFSLFSTVVTYPIDTVRDRMAIASIFGAAYSSTWGAFSEIIFTEGFSALWCGLTVRIFLLFLIEFLYAARDFLAHLPFVRMALWKLKVDVIGK